MALARPGPSRGVFRAGSFSGRAVELSWISTSLLRQRQAGRSAPAAAAAAARSARDRRVGRAGRGAAGGGPGPGRAADAQGRRDLGRRPPQRAPVPRPRPGKPDFGRPVPSRDSDSFV